MWAMRSSSSVRAGSAGSPPGNMPTWPPPSLMKYSAASLLACPANMWSRGVLRGLDIDAMDPSANPGKQLMENGACLVSHRFRPDQVSVMGAVEQHLRANIYALDVADVELHLVHADPSHNGRRMPFYQNVPFARQGPR